MLNPDLRSVETFAGKERTKEFFAMSAEDAYAILEAIAKISGTADRLHLVSPTGEEIRDKEQAEQIEQESRRGPFRFSMCNIPVGATIEFVSDPEKTAEVVDDSKILFNGEVTSLSAAATRLLGYKYGVQRPAYWMYEGQRLSEIRDALGV